MKPEHIALKVDEHPDASSCEAKCLSTRDRLGAHLARMAATGRVVWLCEIPRYSPQAPIRETFQDMGANLSASHGAADRNIRAAERLLQQRYDPAGGAAAVQMETLPVRSRCGLHPRRRSRRSRNSHGVRPGMRRPRRFPRVRRRG